MPRSKVTSWPEMTAEYLRSIMHYAADTGIMTWSVKRGAATFPGMEGGRVRPDGYRQIKIDRKMYLVHRLAWLFVHGAWPKEFIDHINMNRIDNRLENLRECSRSQNGANRPATKRNAAGLKGVHEVEWTSGKTMWKAQIYITKNGARQMEYLGCFKTKEEAHAVYAKRAAELFGEFARVA